MSARDASRPSEPLLTIVLPVHKVQAYLQECLDSILTQDVGDVQVVAVDDHSPDHCGEILDAAAALDPRLEVVHLEQNVGLGQARNAGLERARGRYVMFLDSDDTLTDGALSAITEQIEALGEPDMLVVDHARTYWWGKVARNIKHADMEELAGQVFTLDEHPEVLHFLQVAWNKVCRRDFLEREGLSFPTGYYEDTPWTHKAYFTARSIGVVPQVCVLYRQRRHGSILGSRSTKHFDAFDQWEAVFAFLRSRPDLAHWHHVIVRRMVQHYTTVLTNTHRLHPADRKEFLARASAQLRTLAGPRPEQSEGMRDGLYHSLIHRGDVRLFDSVLKASTTRRAVIDRSRSTVRRGRKVGSRARRATHLGLYRAFLRRPVDEDLAVFATLWNRGYGGNPAAIYEAMREVAPQVHGVWVVSADRVEDMPPGVAHVVPGSTRYWEVMARAKYFVNDVNFPDDIVKRPGQVHVQTQHGTPLKHMGLDLMPHPAASKGMVFRNLLRRSDRWDVNLSANRFSTLVWERAFPSPFTSLESGYPRNDALLRGTDEDIVRIRRELGIPAGKKAVLFAPTHRDHDKHFTIRADLRRLAEDLGDEFVLLVRAHYFYRWMPDLDRLEEEGLLLNVSRHPVVEDLMLASDVLVTDYSSIMFDYANLDRPVVVYAPDWETYRDIRGTYFDIFETTPGLTVRTQEEVAAALVDGTADGPQATAARAAFRERFCEFDDGRASERVVRRVVLGEQLLPIVPLAERTLPPVPHLLSYGGEQPTPHAADAHESAEAAIERHLESVQDPVATGEEDSAGAADPEVDTHRVRS